MDIGAPREQRLDHRGMPFGRRPHQRRLSAPRFLGVHIGSVSQQHVHGVHLPGARGGHEDRLAAREHRARLSAGLQEQFDRRRASVEARKPERRHAVPIRRLHVGAGRDQPRHCLDVVDIRRFVKRRRAIGPHTGRLGGCYAGRARDKQHQRHEPDDGFGVHPLLRR